MMTHRWTSLYGILSILGAIGYLLFFSMERSDYLRIATAYSGLFVLFFLLYQLILKCTPASLGSALRDRNSIIVCSILLSGLVFRLVFLFETPNLSQDFFRFIWDGHQLINGYNPYLYLPDQVISSSAEHIPNADFLHESMGTLSSGHYTNYPPLNQLLFAAAAYLGGESLVKTMVWLRIFIVVADLGILLIGLRLLRILGLPIVSIALYFLNPFIIIELTGNLHFEGVMAFFLLLGIYYIAKQKWIKGSYAISAGVLIKLLPVIALPVLLKRLGTRRLVMFSVLVFILCVIGYAPFVSSDLLEKYAASVGLWFGKFEFNASIYYLVRWVGFELVGYNVIGVVGRILPLLTVACVCLVALLRENNRMEILLSSLLFSFCIYLLFSTTVHPWYLTIPLLLSVFTRYRFMVVWSLLVFLSYSAYSMPEYKEQLALVALEYLVVLVYLLFEVRRTKVLPQNSIAES